MIGAIAGDIVGSVHEWAKTKRKDFAFWALGSRFTDDTVLTVAVAEHLLTGHDLVDLFHAYVHAYPEAGYGGTFLRWATSRSRAPYGSWGNGSAMRVSPVGFAATSRAEALDLAARTASVTHDHREGVRGAQAVALAIYLARTGTDKTAIRRAVENDLGYDLAMTLDEIRPTYRFDVSCQGSVPQAIVAFLESSDYEDALRNAISLGGDADTMACIAGGIAEAFYGGVPEPIRARALAYLDERLLGVVEAFERRFGSG
ncbi:MAG: ADP-ribosylglycohydrolase family protein [Trueperaceae bacterium]